MNSIVNHISDLLYDHECVVIPGFGALISRYYPAEINSATHMMRPPSRRIAFNSRISDNDGLLGNFLSRKENISYMAAMAGIEEFVQNWNKDLKEGKKVYLPGVGRFYLDGNSKIQFNPSIDINYHKGSYGLSIFRGHALQREIEINRGVQKAIEKHIPSIGRKTKPVQKSMRPSMRWAAVVTPLIALGLAAGIYIQSSSSAFYDYAGFFQFGKQVNDITEMPEKHPLTSHKEAKVLPVLPSTASPEISDVYEEETKEITSPTDVNTAPSYHIVVGSFKDKENAFNYVQDLKSRGFDAYIAEGDTNFRRVAIGNFSAREEAVELLASVKKDVNPSSWIFSN